MKTVPIYQVDAFTSELFGGNPAAVCPLGQWLPDQTMQDIAMENNLSETAFFVKKGESFDIRWFTPKSEIDLAGHPTLATAHVIFKHLNYRKKEILFSSKSGLLRARRHKGLIQLDFPSRPPVEISPDASLTEALGKQPVKFYKSRDLMALFATEKDIRELKPNFHLLSQVDMHGLIVTATGEKSDFVSRFFAPSIGINEDPVTGSAHATLIPFWAEKTGKDEMLAYQLSERGGELFCQFGGERVFIAGKAVTFMIGEIRL